MSTTTCSTTTCSTIFQPRTTAERTHEYPLQLQQLIHRLQKTPYLTPEQTKEAVEQANLSTADLMPWASFDHPVSDSYGRKLVFYGGHFEIMVMSWLPGDFSAIHDHGQTQWGAVQCFGSAEHFVYQLEGDRLSSPTPAPYTPKMVRAVDHSLIHQMGNSSDQPFLSLHIYGCGDASHSITGNARIFDLFENSIQHTDGGVFFDLPEAQINHRRYGLSAATETIFMHHCLMRDRLQRILEDRSGTIQLTPSQIQRFQQKLTVLRAEILSLNPLGMKN